MNQEGISENETGPSEGTVLTMLSQLPMTDEVRDELDDGQGAHASSEGDDGAEAGEPKARKREHSSDEDEAPGEAPPVPTNSKVILRLAQRDRELAEARTQIRDMQRAIEESQTKVPDVRALPRMDAVRWTIAQKLGVDDPKDPRVTEELKDLMSDILFDDVDEKSLSTKDLEQFRQQKAQRQKDREDRDWKRSMEERALRAEREKADIEARQQEAATNAAATKQVTEQLTADAERYPFLMDLPVGELKQLGADSASALVTRLAIDAIKSQAVTVSSIAEERALVAKIAANLNAHYEGLANALAPRIGNKSANAGSKRADAGTREAPTRKTGAGRTASGAGGGGRGRPVEVAPQETADDGVDSYSIHDEISRGMQREFRTRRGR